MTMHRTRLTAFGYVDDSWKSPWEINTRERIDGYDLKELMRRFFELTDKTEVSDNDVEFKPNRLEIYSCRCLDGAELGWLIDKIKELIK